MPRGQCHCGAVRYEMSAHTTHQALCHCSDCRRHSGAPMVAWGLVDDDKITIEGETQEYASSEHGRRHFCPKCGTGLFYTSKAIFPGQIDVQTATLDDPDAIVPDVQIQTADRIGWMKHLSEMPEFARYPPPKDPPPIKLSEKQVSWILFLFFTCCVVVYLLMGLHYGRWD